MPKFKEYLQDVYPEVSLESLIDGVKAQEIEFTMYVELEDLNELKKKAIKSETQEQWLIPLDKDEVGTDGKIRIRLIDNARPTMATKIKREGLAGCEEVESDISMDMYHHLREMAVGGYAKTRYCVPSTIQGLIWEIDVFYGNGGAQHPWVKVDLEVKNLNDPIPTFPLAHGKVIFADGTMTYSDSMKVKELWDKQWQKLDRKIVK